MSRRMDRINVLLRQEISKLLAEDLRDPRISPVVSITRVNTTPDLSRAKVFVSVLGNEKNKKDTMIALRSAAGFIHRSMRHRLDLKAIPSLHFQLDESIERGAEILQLIKEVAPGPAEE